jgi:hypothetical protein
MGWYNPKGNIIDQLPKIFLFTEGSRDVAIAEDGTVLAETTRLAIEDWMHGRLIFRDHYPDGYQVLFVEDVVKHPGARSAIALNIERKKNEGNTD